MVIYNPATPADADKIRALLKPAVEVGANAAQSSEAG
jgi:hypothetical protein